MTDPHPEGLGVSTCINLALKDGGIERDEVSGASLPACLCAVGLLLLPCWLPAVQSSVCGGTGGVGIRKATDL